MSEEKKKRMNRFSIKDQIERYNITEEEAVDKIKKLKSNINKWNLYSVKDQMKRYNITEEEAELKIKNIKDVNVYSVEWQMKRFNLSEKDANNKVNDIKNKTILTQLKMNEFDFNSMIPSKKEHWIKKGYTEEDAILKTFEIIKNAKNNCRLFNIERTNNPEKYIGICDTSIEYYLKKGYTKIVSKNMLKSRQSTFSMSKCVDKYGEVDGLKKWNNRQKKWLESLIYNGNLKNGYSKISNEMFFSIAENFNIEESKEVRCYSINGEFYINNNNSYYLYDFKYLNKIIEFNGDVFHGNPSIYKENDICINFKNNPLIAKELWERDKIKINLAINNGFDVLVIWESEYKKNKELVIKKCIEFLRN